MSRGYHSIHCCHPPQAPTLLFIPSSTFSFIEFISISRTMLCQMTFSYNTAPVVHWDTSNFSPWTWVSLYHVFSRVYGKWLSISVIRPYTQFSFLPGSPERRTQSPCWQRARWRAPSRDPAFSTPRLTLQPMGSPKLPARINPQKCLL